MKKLLLLATVGAMCMTGCTQKNSYTITGTGENLADGDSIFLLEIVGGDIQRMAATAVKNGTFEFAGKIDTLKGIRLIGKSADDPQGLLAQVFIESGKINVKLNKDGFEVSGTKANDAFQEFINVQKEESGKLESLYKELSSEGISEERSKAITEQLQKAEDKFANETVLNIITKNLDNEFGLSTLEQLAFSYPAEKLQEILKKVPEQSKNDARILRLQKNIEKQLNLSVGKSMIDLTLNTPEGTPLALSEVVAKNKFTLIDFWASWCGPCRGEAPHLVKAYNTYHAKGFEIIGVSFDNEKEAWVTGIKELGFTWPQVSDLKGWESIAGETYNIRSIPSTILVDQSGKIVARDLRGEALEEELAKLLP